MYKAFYGLSAKPFQLNPDPSFYFGSKQHRRAAAYLDYGMHQHEGFIVITGEVGAGKTTIVRGMLDGLDESKVFAAHLVSTQLDADDTLQLVGAAFGLRTRGVSKADVLMTLEAFLVSMTSKGKRCLLVVDEAQNLTARAVEELRMLSNFQFGNHALLQSFLIGQPEFRQILQSPQMMQFRQRVIAACHIGPLDIEDTQAYIEHRLKRAGSTGVPLIRPAAYEAIFLASGGIPRRINSVCDRLLLLGYLNGKKEFDASEVEEVAHEIHEETMGTATPAVGLTPAPAAAAPASAPPAYAQQLLPRARAVDDAFADDPVALLASLNVQQFGERLRRLETSMLQIEKLNGATLELLQKLIASGNQIAPRKKNDA
jgi:putative secretion ATPase (PEP-CTERM system associated)